MSVKGFNCCEFLLLLVSSVCVVLGNSQNIVYRSPNDYGLYFRSVESTTECITAAPGSRISSGESGVTTPASPIAAISTTAGVPANNMPSETASKLHALVQHIYAAQARVQLEANEIKKTQGVATSAQKSLEDAANNVRIITAALQTAQQEVAAAAIRAQSAQMQLAAHDQLLFAARQKVDALSSEMVGLQVEDGVVAPKTAVNIPALLAQLKEPLLPNQTPTPIPAVDDSAKDGAINSADTREIQNYDGYFMDT